MQDHTYNFSPVRGGDLLWDMTFLGTVGAALILCIPKALNIGKKESACRCKLSLTVTNDSFAGEVGGSERHHTLN